MKNAYLLNRAVAAALAKLAAVILMVAAFTGPACTEPSIRDSDRIVFVGDSITGQGGNNGTGAWVQLIGAALKAAHPGAAQVLVPLGGSGQTAGSWTNIEMTSRTKAQTLDVKAYDVKTELDKPADVLVVMLGMNDVLSPSLRDTPNDIDHWAAMYEALVQTLRVRTRARVVGVATITPCTEDPNSPKNQVVDKLNEQIIRIAKEDGFILLPTNATAWSVLAEGRTYNTTFRVTVDTVHPSSTGHLAIATGMLEGFGEDAAVKVLRQQLQSQEFSGSAGPLPDTAFQLTPMPSGGDADHRNMLLEYWWHGRPAASGNPVVRVDAPGGFLVSPSQIHGAHGVFHVLGLCDRLQTKLSLAVQAGAATESFPVNIPIGWIAGATPPNRPGWTIRNPWTFDPVVGALPIDAELSTGSGFDDASISVGGVPIHWVHFTPSIAYVGGSDPNSVDFGGVSFFGNFADGYAARWVYSQKDRPVQFAFTSQAWGGNDHLQVWVNGQSIYAGHFGRLPVGKGVAPSALKTGWNAVVFKSAHLQWLWQVSVAIQPVGADNLDDLRYSVVPHPSSARTR